MSTPKSMASVKLKITSPPNISSVILVATVTGGTGRFAGATGRLTVRFTQIIDFADASAQVSGSIDGVVSVRQ